ncbi:nucleoside-diphosphate sugar epimerase/dehydratase [Fusicatenibacter faecihominis]|uniref:Polysaccharide biosynthesis protein n=1 Tax=Fusicatenibacter faecihominis TaxID=2881276 RepID=A0AAE3DUV9_9FIRM|nr:nucleoside-diphosphate sugar epimerase/dehydratase [Fusicatenibacter faecihominis]MCC2190984.1 polysaccharide biosynthesis protein [Fusicatenibacter faecihominis]
MSKKEERERKAKIQHWKVIAFYLVVYDIIAVNFSYFLGLWLRFDLQYSNIPREYLSAFLKFAPVYTVAVVIVFYILRLYNSLWRFASFNELNRIFAASVITTVIQIVGITALFVRMPFSYYVVGAATQFALITVVRFAYRFINMERARREQSARSRHNVMVIGAGAAGQTILRELQNSKEISGKACCVIDDNPNKWNRYMDGVPVVGGRDSIMEMAKKYKIDEIFFAIPTASIEDKRDILNICKETGCDMKSLPGLYQLANGDVSLSKLKPVAVEDLLGRDPIKVNMDEIFSQLKGKVIMVTGGGGSIGSELCRQIAAHDPKELVIFDVYENNAYDIQQELKKKYPNLKLDVIIGSVRDSRKIFKVFETYHPEIVYHAAAHKHVPLMEDSPCEAIKNNAIGTYKTAYAAISHGCKKFVFISTDKAVNPTNIMGASKRLCEMEIQAFDHKVKEGKAWEIPQIFTHWMDEVVKKPEVEETLKNAKTEFVAVRFGNVLGSNGSVIPLFKKQIEAGGPVTVTHPDIIRYFMTIPEAVSLVLQAGTYAHGGEIFVLDMGQPVKIDTLARNLIRLSGHTPDGDIKIEYTGLRPGEKLYEEKLMAEEGLKKTENELIHIGCPIPFDIEEFLKELDALMEAAYKNDDKIRERVEQIVTTYHPA